MCLFELCVSGVCVCVCVSDVCGVSGLCVLFA